MLFWGCTLQTVTSQAEANNLLWSLVLHFEGCYLKPYRCPAGVWTIGVGTIRYPNGQAVTPRDRAITKEEAKSYAWHELNQCLKNAIRYSPVLAEYPDKLAAIASFIYNLGAGAYQGSTLRRRINEEDWDGAKAQILRWNKAGGVVLKGLTRRRQAEAALL